MSKQTTSRPGGNGSRSQGNRAGTRPTEGARKDPRPTSSTAASQPRKPAPNTNIPKPPVRSTARPTGMTAQQRIQAQQAAARQQKTGGWKLRPLDLILLAVGVLVVGFVVWSAQSGTNQATPTGQSAANNSGNPSGNTGAPPAAPSPTPLPIGSVAPAFSLPGADGKTHSLADYKGKVVLLEFFAPWCPHCQDDAPMLNNVAAHFKDNPNVQLLAISASPRGRDGESPITMEDITWFRDEFKVNFPILFDKELVTAETYSILFYPTVYIVGKDGNIASEPAGFFTWQNGKPVSSRDQPFTQENLISEIEKYLK